MGAAGGGAAGSGSASSGSGDSPGAAGSDPSSAGTGGAGQQAVPADGSTTPSNPDAGPGGASNAPESVALAFSSFPRLAAVREEPYHYRLTLDRPAEAVFSLERGPVGASLDGNGTLKWTPGTVHAPGDYEFVVKADADGEAATQTFSLRVSKVTAQVSQQIEADAQGSAVLTVDSPLSAVQGSGVIVPEGALRENAVLQIGSVESPSLPPALEGTRSKVVDFGPSGTAFSKPVRVVLPISQGAAEAIASGAAKPEAWTKGVSGIWESLKVAHADPDARTLVVEASHFSQFLGDARPETMTCEGFANSTCSGKTFVACGLTDSTLADFEGTWINGAPLTLGGAGWSAVLGAMPDGTHFQLVLRLELEAEDGEYARTAHSIVNLRKTASKWNARLVDGAGSLKWEAQDVDPMAGAVLGQVQGTGVRALFRDVPADFAGTLRASAYGYLRASGQGDGLPSSAGFAFAERLIAVEAWSTLADDSDCDGVPDALDGSQALYPEPELAPLSAVKLRTLVGTPASLSVEAKTDDPASPVPVWQTDASATLVVSDDGTSAMVTSTTPGLHEVTVLLKDRGGEARTLFSVFVDKPVENTAPRCDIVASSSNVFVGEAVALRAIVSDGEQAEEELSIRWNSSASSALSVEGDGVASFTPSQAAQYSVECYAHDGELESAAGKIQITAIPRPANSPPELLFVSPLSKSLIVTPGEVASQLLYARAADADGDDIKIEFTLLEGEGVLTPSAVSGTDSPGEHSAARMFQATAVGAYSVLVRAEDVRGASSDSMTVKLLVSPDLSAVDQDDDGYPAEIDCDDSDGAIYPGAPEICGDGVDQNCSGVDRALADCDVDGDGYTTAAGDCDDANRSRFPGASERCNGADDNCNGKIDEGYTTGDACSLGTGACAAQGTMVCASGGAGAVCDAQLNPPTAEFCNGIDDNCDGAVDNVPDTGTMDVTNCGGCGIACEPNANQEASCQVSASGDIGCDYACSAGYIDLDGSPLNGCEYACTAGGSEVCDGSDNDCDGQVDENTLESFYTGPAGTLGVGDCRSGIKACEAGQLVITQAEVVPGEELCDGRDNDCDGQSDDGFALGAICDGADSDLCQNGVQVCSADRTGVVCSAESASDLRDVCDGADNDCDSSTTDGFHDAQLGASCDAGNTSFCSPGSLVCQSGSLMCSDADRAPLNHCGKCDAMECECPCDLSSGGCDTDGSGFICECDLDCTGPDAGCACDLGPGCDAYDGDNECTCDPECSGQVGCSCDITADICDAKAGGWVCGCDTACEAMCACDLTAGACDVDAAGVACFCDTDCGDPGSCFCDDLDPTTCAVDADGNGCPCDPECGAVFDCNCDASPTTCDSDSAGGACFCDPQCEDPSGCFCDDLDPTTCAVDADGNGCPCDPECGAIVGCNCDAVPATCDPDSAGGACFCDPDCGVPGGCACDDLDSTTCAMDADGKPCLCDPECGPGPECGCDASPTTCDPDSAGGACFCDPDCEAPSSCFCDDLDPTTCAIDADGNPCHCDPECGATACLCDLGAGCDVDPATGGDCYCDIECASPSACNCDVSAMACDLDSSGLDYCFCDPNCDAAPACFCDDQDPSQCAVDADGNACFCDPECGGEPACGCDVVPGFCDADPGTGGDCSCDPDCLPI